MAKRLGRGIVRVRVPNAPLGELEVLYAGSRPTGPKRPSEGEVTDHAGSCRRSELSSDIWFVKDDKHSPTEYAIKQVFNRPDGWAVISHPSGAIASCPMSGFFNDTGTESEAREWADALNEKFGSSAEEA